MVQKRQTNEEEKKVIVKKAGDNVYRHRAIYVEHNDYSTIVQHYELAYDKDHNVVKVPGIREDIRKSVESHKDEVGLVNVIKMATAKGIDPKDHPFASSKDESLPDLPDVETWDDVEKARQEAIKNLQVIAKKLGISAKDLEKAVDNNSVAKIAEEKLAKPATESEDNK